jgi:hypothetical protein
MTTVLQNGLLTITGPGTGILGGGEGSTFDINGVDAVTIDTIGSEIVIRAGNPTGTAKGGDISIESGDGNTSGDIIISTGTGGSGKGDITFDSADGEITLLCDTGSIFINGNTINLKVRTLDTLRFPSENGFITRYLKIGSISSGVAQLKWASIFVEPEIRPPNPGGRVITQTWTARTASDNYLWRDVVWSPELRLFCAVSENGAIGRAMTSPDGINWTTQAGSALDGTFQGITWSPELGLFCAVGNALTSRIMTSPDGITWTSRLAPEANQWYKVVWAAELGIFCAVAQNGTNRVMTSPDGITWTPRAAASASTWINIAWSPQRLLFCAVAIDGSVMTSPNGTVWTSRTAAEPNQWYGITWSPELGLFCASAQSGTNRIMTSPNGTTWTARAVPEANSWRVVTWAPEAYIFCALSLNGTNRVMVSTDGINWALRPGQVGQWLGIAWSPELEYFVAISNVLINVMTSLV